MIAKQVAMRSARKSDYGELVKYITDTQGSQERVGRVAITNCQSLDAPTAALEVQATQQLNTRSRADKTYHLIVSFRAGENPPDQVLEAIESKICQELGFGEHQRVSAAHYDTDNVHLHIAINKVHPTRHTVHSPYFDHLKLPEICGRLEIEFGLEQDNHLVQKRGSENRAEDMERHAGVESLQTWIRKECLDRIDSAKTWRELHDSLHEHGLELRMRANGFVFVDLEGVHVKASSVSRGLSKQKLEARLGVFEPSVHGSRTQEARATYTKRPVSFQVDTKALHQEYTAELADSGRARSAESDVLRRRQRAEVDAVKAAGAGKRAAIKLVGGDRLSRKILYSLASRGLKKDLAVVRERHRLERRFLNQQYARKAWADWLKAKATQGNEDALNALRSRMSRQGLKGNAISGSGEKSPTQMPNGTQDTVTKKGTVVFRTGDTAIRDDGDRLQVSRGADRGGIHKALQMATARFGQQITVNGSAEFKARVVATAAAQRLQISFVDPDLERRFQTLLVHRKGLPNDGKDRLAVDGGSHGARGPATGASAKHGQHDTRTTVDSRPLTTAVRDTDAGAAAIRGADEGAGSRGGKPNIGGIGKHPPPFRKNRLHDLRELGLVRNQGGSQVLLQSDVSRDLEHQGSSIDGAVRRPIPRPGLTPGQSEAAQKLIAERNGKRGFGFDIPKYGLYTPTQDAVLSYAGMRTIDGVNLALFARNGDIAVMPVDPATASKLKRVRIGDTVTLTAQGTVKSKGRSR